LNKSNRAIILKKKKFIFAALELSIIIINIILPKVLYIINIFVNWMLLYH